MDNEELEVVEENTKFKVGDKVKIVENVKVGEEIRGTTFVDGMTKFLGQEAKIDSIAKDKTYSLNGYYFDESWLEPLEPLEQSKKEEKVEIKLEETPTKEDIEEMISKVDVNTFLKIIRARVLCEDNPAKEVTKAKINKYLKKWAESKFRFYKLFGRNLKIKRQIELEKDNRFYEEHLCLIKSKFPLYRTVLDNIYLEDIKNNKMTRNSAHYLFDDEKIKEGMKFTKLIALFKNNDLNMEVSKIYQDKSIKEINISIDPCDYLTVSINKIWRSCHNFINGEWRNAGLSLMIDNTSMVSYTSSGEVTYNFEDEIFKWNNKTWRQMIYLSETNSQLIFSLQYPYRSEEISRCSRNLIEDKLSEYLKIPNKWKVLQSKDNIYVDCSDLMYNDIGRDGCKYVINKYDINMNCNIKTGSKDIPKINDASVKISYGDEGLWY